MSDDNKLLETATLLIANNCQQADTNNTEGLAEGWVKYAIGGTVGGFYEIECGKLAGNIEARCFAGEGQLFTE